MHCYIIFFCLFLQGLFANSALQSSLDLSVQCKNDPNNYSIYECLKDSIPPLNQATIIESLYKFLSPWGGENLIIINSKETFLSGKSHDLVYFVLNQDGSLQYVIKAFRSPFKLGSKFLAELSSIQFLQRLNLTHIGGITPLDTAQGRFENEEWVFLLETAAPGIRLDQFIYQIYFNQCTYETALNAYYAFGKALAEFHCCNSHQLAPLSARCFNDFANYLEEVLKHTQATHDLKERIDLTQFEISIRQVIERAKNILIPLTYQHGDAHMGNIFFDIATAKVTFIDVAVMNHSFSKDFEPLANGFADLYRADEYFKRKADGFLTNNQIEEISNIILKGYMSVNPFPPPKEIEQFYRTYYKLRRLLHFSDYMEEPDEEKRLRRKVTYEKALDYFTALASSSDIIERKGAN